MIFIDNNIQLRQIESKDYNLLYNLMKEIYPQAYKHFWEDSGDWYVDKQYSKEHVLKELSQENADYYFILYKNEIIGNFRIVWGEKLKGLPQEKQVKLHRVYLHKKTHGKGIGKTLILWLEELAKQKEYKIIWLDAMDCKSQALQFYKKLGYKYKSHILLPFDLMFLKLRKLSQLYKELI